MTVLDSSNDTDTTTNNNSGGDEARQYVWIVRYGLTEHPLVENIGPFDSDIDPKEGIEHAKCIAQRLAESGPAAPTVVYASPFLRTVHTAHIIATQSHGCKVRIEEGLTEWQVPSLLVTPDGNRTIPRSTREHAQRFDTVDVAYTSCNPSIASNDQDQDHENECNAHAGSPHFPETEGDLVVRCASTLDKLLALSDHDTSIVLVSHAPCNIAMALHLEGIKLHDSKQEPWPLGGLTLFSRPARTATATTANRPWKLEFYGCPKHMPGDYKAGLKAWTLPSLQSSGKQE